MHLTKSFVYKPSAKEKIILDCLAYASTKLWNIGNYEKKNYKELGLSSFPNWYDQKKSLKNNFWYKNLPSQTAQDVLDKLHKSWKSFFKLRETKGIINPQPPRFKKKTSLSNFRYLNNGFTLLEDNKLKFSIPKQLKVYLKEKHNIDDNFLLLKMKCFSNINNIKTIEFKPLNNGKYKINAVYQIEEPQYIKNNNKYLSIDLGIKNLFTCYDNIGHSFIVSGSKYLNINYYYNKKIAYYQSIAYKQQIAKGSKYGKDTKRIKKLYDSKAKQLNYYLHCATKHIQDYCKSNNISTVLIGDIKNIRNNKNLGNVNNQKLHSLPYDRIYSLLEYKLKVIGIKLIKVKESYSSQCCPTTPIVSKEYATKTKRVNRGLFISERIKYNADSVGAYNILRLYEQKEGITIPKILKGLSNPLRLNVAV